jgi:hypothetical protein
MKRTTNTNPLASALRAAWSRDGRRSAERERLLVPFWRPRRAEPSEATRLLFLSEARSRASLPS